MPEQGLGLAQLLLLGELIMSMGNGDDEEDNDRDIGCVLVHLLRLGDLPPPSITFLRAINLLLAGQMSPKLTTWTVVRASQSAALSTATATPG